MGVCVDLVGLIFRLDSMGSGCGLFPLTEGLRGEGSVDRRVSPGVGFVHKGLGLTYVSGPVCSRDRRPRQIFPSCKWTGVNVGGISHSCLRSFDFCVSRGFLRHKRLIN